MIRKLASGEYRLYSRKKNPRTGKRRNLGTFKSRAPPNSTSAKCSTSSGIVREHVHPVAAAASHGNRAILGGWMRRYIGGLRSGSTISAAAEPDWIVGAWARE